MPPAGSKVRCSKCTTIFYVPFKNDLDFIDWVNTYKLNKVKKFLSLSLENQFSVRTISIVKRIYEFRRWSETSQSSDDSNGGSDQVDLSIENKKLERLKALEIEQGKEKSRLEEKKAKKLEREAKAKSLILWAYTADWSQLDEFILKGRAKGLDVSTVDQLVKIYTERRWVEEDKNRVTERQRNETIRRRMSERIENADLRSIHEELSNFTRDSLLDLGADEFEEFVGRLFQGLGYRTEVVGGSFDNGVDVSIWLDDSLFGIAQCKRYTDKNVSASQVRDFVGAFMATDAIKAYFFTTSGYTKSAVETASKFSCIDLYDLDRINSFVNETRQRIERRKKIAD